MDENLIAALIQLVTKLDIVGDLKTQLALLTSQITILGDSLGKLNIVVLGNGKKGHSDRIRDLEETANDLKDWRDELKRERLEQQREMRGVRNTMIVSVIMLIISTIINIVIHEH